MNNKELAHRWINQIKDSGQGSNFFYRGTTIYSWGDHFPIARIVYQGTGTKQRKAVLFTTRNRSNSTARHKSLTRQAIDRELPVFDVDNVLLEPWDKRHLEFYQAHIDKHMAVAREKKNHLGIRELDLVLHWVTEGNKFCKFFKLKHRFKLPRDYNKERARLAPLADAYYARKRDRDTKRAEGSRLAAQEKKERWLKGERVDGMRWAHALGYPVLRLSPDSGTRSHGEQHVESSWGVTVPIEDAKLAWEAIEQVVQRGRPFAIGSRGLQLQLGGYRIDSISQDGTLNAGCHHIPYAESLRFARLMGWVSEKHWYQDCHMPNGCPSCTTNPAEATPKGEERP